MLEEMGEENIYGTMLTEPQNLDSRRLRRGFNYTQTLR